MADLLEANERVKKGVQWRGTITVEIDDEDHELTVRPLKDPEMVRLRSLVDLDELGDVDADLSDSEEWEEYTDLVTSSDLSEEEEERLAQLEDELEAETEDEDLFSEDLYEALSYVAKRTVVPDDEDAAAVLRDQELATEMEEKYNTRIQSQDDAKEVLNQEIEEMVDNSTNLVSVRIGVKALTEALGDQGN